MNLLAKGTLLITSGTAREPDKKHLFVICTDPCEKGLQVIVPIATWINDLCDNTCQLKPHEHAFIRHLSYVLYRKAETIEHKALAKGVREDVFIPHQDMNAQTHLRIFKGVCKSKQTPRKIKRYLDCPEAQEPEAG